MVVDRSIFLDKGVGGRDVSFGLVVVVVRDEVFHGVVREERLEFAIQLGCQGFVGGKHQRRTVNVGNDVGDAECFARACYPEQGLV